MEVSEVRKLTPEMRREQTRNYLMEAAAAVFAARGFHAASLDEIAETAGFTKGAIYSHFESKEDLYLALQKERQDAMLEEFFAVARDHPEDPAGGMSAITDVYARLAPTPAEIALYREFTLYALRNPEMRERVDAENRAMFTALTALVAQHCKDLEIEPAVPVESLARLYLAIFDGLTSQRMLDPEGVPVELFAEMVGFVEDALKALGTATATAEPGRR